MRFEPIETSQGFIKMKGVVEFDADDLQTPGAGFQQFFRHLTQDQSISQAKFDAEVLATYQRQPAPRSQPTS
jgi:hypothetical protein